MTRSARWLAASSIWLVGGFAFPLLAPATTLLSATLQRYLSSAAGMPEELAFRVAFTIFRIPLTAALAILIAAAQCAVVRDLGTVARRWIVAAAVASCLATLIFLPSGLVALQFYGDTSTGMVRVFLLVIPGAGLLGGLVSFLQKRSVRKKVFVPGWVVLAGALAAAIGVLAGMIPVK